MTNLKEAKATARIDLEGAVFARIENWRRAQAKIPSRSQAILKLLEQALAAAEQRRTAA